MAMEKRVSLALALVVLAGGMGAKAQNVAATGKSEVLPATTAPDYSEPKKTITAFLNAVQSTDDASIRDALVIAPEQASAVDAYIKLIIATNKLQKAAEKRFGEQAEQYFGISTKQMESRLKSVQDAEAKIVGDSAIIQIPADEATHQPGGTIVAKKIGDQWKLDAGTLFRLADTPKDQTDKSIVLATKMAPLSDQMTSDIEAGKFASASEAYQTFWQRSLDVVKSAETQPATNK